MYYNINDSPNLVKIYTQSRYFISSNEKEMVDQAISRAEASDSEIVEWSKLNLVEEVSTKVYLKFIWLNTI